MMTRTQTHPRNARRAIWLMAGLLASFLAAPAAHAAPSECTVAWGESTLQPTVPASISSARDGQQIGGLVVPGALTTAQRARGYTGVGCKTKNWIVTGLGKPIPNVTYTLDGRSHPVLETGIPGIGYALMAKVRPSASASAGTWKAIGSGAVDLRVGDIDPTKSPTIDFRAAIVFSGPLTTGTYKMSTATVASVRTLMDDGTQLDAFDMRLNEITINVVSNSCSLLPGSPSTLGLPKVYGGSLKNIGDASSESEQFSLSVKCQGKLSVYVTLTDVNDPTNTTTALKLSEGSTATGIGIQFFKRGSATPIRFGPDSSAKDNPNQWLAGQVTNGGTVTIPLVAKYVKTAEQITAGSVEARASFTFSYQ